MNRIFPSKREAAVFSGSSAFHVFALDEKGRIHGFGSNSHGQLGFGDRHSRNELSHLPFFDGLDVVEIACGYVHTLARINCGDIFSFGHNLDGELGRNGTPEKVQKSEMLSSLDVIQMSCGKNTSFCLSSDGVLFSLGLNDEYQLGDGTSSNRAVPRAVQFPVDVRIAYVAAGRVSVSALAMDGSVYTWGCSEGGRIGRKGDRRVPMKVKFKNSLGGRIRFLAAGSDHTFAFELWSGAFCWGINANASLSPGTPMKRSENIKTPMLSTFGSDLELLAFRVGGGHAFFFSIDRDEQRLFALGDNESSQLCLKVSTEQFEPSEVKLSVYPEDCICGFSGTTIVTKVGDLYAAGYFGTFPRDSEKSKLRKMMTDLKMSRPFKWLADYIIELKSLSHTSSMCKDKFSIAFSDIERDYYLPVDRFVFHRLSGLMNRVTVNAPYSDDILDSIFREIFEDFGGAYTTRIQKKSVAVVLSRLYAERETFGDVIVSSSNSPNEIHHAHRFILCARSRYFSALFTGSWKESNSKEVKIDMPLGASFRCFLEFLYTGVFIIDSLSEAEEMLGFLDYFDVNDETASLRQRCSLFLED